MSRLFPLREPGLQLRKEYCASECLFFLSWASLKYLTGSLLFSPLSLWVEFHWHFVLGVKRSSMLQLALLWGSCNSVVAKRTSCCTELYNLCAGGILWCHITDRVPVVPVLVLPPFLCGNCNRQSPAMLQLLCSCFVHQHLVLPDPQHILSWHTGYTTCPWLAQFVFSVPCFPAGAVWINKPDPSISQSLWVGFSWFKVYSFVMRWSLVPSQANQNSFN